MKSNANTEAPSHLLVVQKNDHKDTFSEAEQLLLETKELENEYGKYSLNGYVERHPELLLGDEIGAGKNQYGKASQMVWQKGDLDIIRLPLQQQITEGLNSNFNQERWKAAQQGLQATNLQLSINGAINTATATISRLFTFLAVPEYNKADILSPKKGVAMGQMGLFDAAPVENNNQAQAYLNDLDSAVIESSTGRLISTIRTTARPDHDSIVMLTARAKTNNRYLYKLYSNVGELRFSNKWLNGNTLGYELKALSAKLKYFGHDYRYEGDRSLEPAFALLADRPAPYTSIKPFYTKDTLVVHQDKAGLIGSPDNGQADFKAFEVQKDKDFYRLYVALRDSYLELSGMETETLQAQPFLRVQLNKAYESFSNKYGELNKTYNRARMLNDAAFGFLVLSSLERKENETWIKADIFHTPVFPKQESLQTDDPAEALARCLNDKGYVDLSYISRATGLDEYDIIRKLDRQILMNPATKAWETIDAYLSGNVVSKLQVAEVVAGEEPDELQLARRFYIRKLDKRYIFIFLDFSRHDE
ncbi:hypothetical protein [Mucilaginibacter sp. 10B2]|nr:hypothetical protein [Mucilaginibacter sp. 10B2]MEB0261956.1 hypothetical protein [Mucilaginibacter sp. 10I4]